MHCADQSILPTASDAYAMIVSLHFCMQCRSNNTNTEVASRNKLLFLSIFGSTHSVIQEVHQLPNGAAIYLRPTGERTVVHSDGTKMVHGTDGVLLVESPSYLPITISPRGRQVYVDTLQKVEVTCTEFGCMSMLYNSLICFQVDQHRTLQCGSDDGLNLPITLQADGNILCSGLVAGEVVHVDINGKLLDGDFEDAIAPLEPKQSPIEPGSARFFVVRRNGDGEEIMAASTFKTILDKPNQIYQDSDAGDLYGTVHTLIEPLSCDLSSRPVPSVERDQAMTHLNSDFKQPQATKPRQHKFLGSAYGSGLVVGVPPNGKKVTEQQPVHQHNLLSVTQYLHLPEMAGYVRAAFIDGLKCLRQSEEQSSCTPESGHSPGKESTDMEDPAFLQWLFARHLAEPKTSEQIRATYAKFVRPTETLRAKKEKGTHEKKSTVRKGWKEEVKAAHQAQKLYQSQEVPGYFDSPDGRHALKKLKKKAQKEQATAAPDMEKLSCRLAKASMSKAAEVAVPVILSGSPCQSSSTVSEQPASRMSEADLPDMDGLGTPLANSTSALLNVNDSRPTNPTPLTAKSDRAAVTSDCMPAKQPVPAATDQKLAQEPQEVQDAIDVDEVSLDNAITLSTGYPAPSSKFVNTTGEFRSSPVTTPPALRGTRAGAAKNEKVQ